VPPGDNLNVLVKLARCLHPVNAGRYELGGKVYELAAVGAGYLGHLCAFLRQRLRLVFKGGYIMARLGGSKGLLPLESWLKKTCQFTLNRLKAITARLAA
jgi:hypothetical protein